MRGRTCSAVWLPSGPVLHQLKTTLQPLLGSAGETSDKSSLCSFTCVPFDLVASPGTGLDNTV